jgi:hypothetical protein
MSSRPPLLVDTLHPRLVIDRYAECFRFYNAVLPELTGAKLAKGDEAGPYARWDVELNEKPVLALLDRVAMAAVTGDATQPPPSDAHVLVFRLADVDAAERLCAEHGGSVHATATDRPEWGPDTRIAYVTDPAGTVIELQSSPD